MQVCNLGHSKSVLQMYNISPKVSQNDTIIIHFIILTHSGWFLVTKIMLLFVNTPVTLKPTSVGALCLWCCV